MSAVINPIPAFRVDIEVNPDAPDLFFVKCSRCGWFPASPPVDEATARIAAYEHNAVKHPKAMVEVESLAQSWAEHTRWLRGRVRLFIALAASVVVIQFGLVALVHGAPAVAFTVFSWSFLGVMQGFYVGKWVARLHDHRMRPPGSLIVSPGTIEDEGPTR